jgi:branched-subunit amino acid transport protein
MTAWLTIFAAGLITYATRLSFILLFERIEIPAWLRRALRFVPAAVLSAIIIPELVFQDGSLALTPANPRLLAGIIAILVAWRTKNILLTLISGMAALWALQAALARLP